MTNYAEQLNTLQLACGWMDIRKGRAIQYQHLIKEFYEEDKRSREHILAFNEASEITDIYELWAPFIDNFPGLEQKIKQVFKKGPILKEDERPNTSTNRPRNDAFVYLLAGKFLKAGIKIIAVDGVPARGYSYNDADITFDWQGLSIDIQCKRPQKARSLTKRIKEARQQLKRGGIIGLECSFVRPPGYLIQAGSASEAEEILNRFLERDVKGTVAAHLDSDILGFFVFARAPAMTKVGYSNILSPRGKNIPYIRRDCISTLLVIVDETSPKIEILRSVYRLLNENNL